MFELRAYFKSGQLCPNRELGPKTRLHEMCLVICTVVIAWAPIYRSTARQRNLNSCFFLGLYLKSQYLKESLELIRFHLVEFATGYEAVKGGEATPVTMLNYTNAI